MRTALRRLTGGVMAMTAAGMAACGDPSGPEGGIPALDGYEFTQLDAGDYAVQFAFQSDGTVWVRTLKGTLIRVAGGDAVYHAESQFGGGEVTDLFRADDGRLWIAFADGFGVLDGTTWERAEAPALKTPGTAIRQIAVNAWGDVLLAAGHAGAGGLLFLHDGSWSALTPDGSPLPNSLVNEIEVDEAGDFWVAHALFGGVGGLSHISGGEVAEVLTTDSGLLYDWVDALEAVGDRLYIGYEVFFINNMTVDGAFPDGGLQILSRPDGGVESRFPVDTDVTSNRVVSMVFHDGYLWFTTGLDEARPGCERCFAGVGRLGPDGTIEVQSMLTGADIPGNAFLPWIDLAPDGTVYTIVEGVRMIPVVF